MKEYMVSLTYRIKADNEEEARVEFVRLASDNPRDIDVEAADGRRMTAPDIPAGHPVQPVSLEEAEDPITCGVCGLTWDDAIVTSYTPAPAARCPFEAFHPEAHA